MRRVIRSYQSIKDTMAELMDSGAFCNTNYQMHSGTKCSSDYSCRNMCRKIIIEVKVKKIRR